jgi:hypothetical protein
VAQVGGLWGGTIQQTSASGDPECLLVFLSANGTTDQNSLQINETGGMLTAAQTSLSTGASCQLSGTASNGSVTLSATACQPNTLPALPCNGNARDAYLVTRTIATNVNGNLMNGTQSDHWNVYASGDTTTVIGTVTVLSSVLMTR